MINIEKLKKAELYILSFVDEFCKKHNIQYSLYAGTLLGAIRHKGFIPWDDDIDICMTRSNFDKFISEWNKDSDNRFYLDNPYDYFHSRNNHAKLRLRNTIIECEDDSGTSPKEKGIFIDIFPLDYLPNKFKTRTILLRILLTRKKAPKRFGIIKRFAINFVVFTMLPIRKIILRNIDSKIKKYNRNNSDQLRTLNAMWGLSHSLSIDLLDEFIDFEFEGRKFPISKKYNQFLKELFCDYMKLPSEEERVYKHSPISVDFGPYDKLFNN